VAKVDQAFVDAHVNAGSTKNQFREALLAKLLEPPRRPRRPSTARPRSTKRSSCAPCPRSRRQLRRNSSAPKHRSPKRGELLAARAAAADNAGIVPVGTNDGGGSNGTDSSVAILAGKRRLQEIIKLAAKEKIGDAQAAEIVDAELKATASRQCCFRSN
jgi:hypothetical protein